MCFSNLPVEFDEEGDPYLADEADEVERPGDVDHDHPACDCDVETGDVRLSADPEAAFEAIVGSLPEGARTHLEAAEGQGTVQGGPDAAEGD